MCEIRKIQKVQKNSLKIRQSSNNRGPSLVNLHIISELPKHLITFAFLFVFLRKIYKTIVVNCLKSSKSLLKTSYLNISQPPRQPPI